jgi:hypothetical protein
LATAFPEDADVARIVAFVRAGERRPFLIPGAQESVLQEDED